ncbi:hypothetical protein GGI04_004340 [Coemansia thaxteri]|uniref:Uncharacterized protein n=1 Tax=Coemansia thaxteri TaxID=2663907 RepID=A0A9W8BHF7_9FUNG|nr:hypothetical protein GGI04_004340 [Coemansia thaxteri]KAJ2007180.1 hypothetical protein H4R26_000946 [Coemansia thaxteri]KAJ2468021.1 hypothetical protein GGI02_003831 [Coemansia sp. RSA 2322]KAJ2486838.1 hypothetical protein EV174_000893 [Coemansia sp. RSA 2320]
MPNNRDMKTISMRLTPLLREMAGTLERVGESDTSDDDVDGAVGLAQRAPTSKAKTVKKALAQHELTACGLLSAGPRKVTRVVKTRKHDSVMGEGLVASEEMKTRTTPDDSDTAGGLSQRSHSPMVGDIGNLRRFIRDKSEHRDAIEPRDVMLPESSHDSRRPPSAYKPPLMGIDASFVPPELAERSVDPATWECFADALNAAIPRSTQEVENQITRWNTDAFDSLGFCIRLVSLDSGLTLSVTGN